MATTLSIFWIIFSVISGLFLYVDGQQCYQYTCTGSRCLQTEVASNPLLIEKCDRVIYRGCYTITTSTNGFFTTTAGCIERNFECTRGTCSGLTVTTEVTCCNTDLCNDGKPTSASNTTRHSKWMLNAFAFISTYTIYIHLYSK